MKKLAFESIKSVFMLLLTLCITFPSLSSAQIKSTTGSHDRHSHAEVLNRQSQLIYFWLFDTSIENDIPLETIEPLYSLIEGGILTFHSALAGYPFNPDHPNWRKASMERRNAPTPINYRPEGNNGLQFEDIEMRGIQIKQPFTGDGGQNTLVFHLPTSDYKEVIFRFAAKDENAADNLVIDYSTIAGDPVWISSGLSSPSPVLTEDYQLFETDFSEITDVNNNPNFKIRIRFSGSNMSADEGDRVTFNNFSIDATSLSTTNLPPQVVNQIPLQELIEEGGNLTFNLNSVFNDPDNDLLEFTATSDRPSMAGIILDEGLLTVIPLKRGDATITLTASDGNYDPAITSFRVLVYPKPFVLSNGQFSFMDFNPDEPEYTYPQHMIFLQTEKDDPDLNDELLFPYFIPHDDYHEDDLATIGFPYNNTRRTRINGLGDEGIAFINTGRNRDLGGALLALDTRNSSEVSLEWLGGTILQNNRIYAIRLMYRTDLFAPFVDLTSNSQIVEYMTADDGDTKVFENIHLPADALNQQNLQLLWKYYFVEGDTSSRAQLRLDDIIIKNIVGVTELNHDLIKFQVTQKSIRLEFSKPLSGNISVFDVAGRVIAKNQFNKVACTIVPLRNVKGLLVVRIVTENNTWSEKILVR